MILMTFFIQEVAEWADAIIIGVKPGIMKYIATDLKQHKKSKYSSFVPVFTLKYF
jgi:pyrroline-5-carboxylate reductase